MTFQPDRTVHQSRLAESYGRMKADVAQLGREADNIKKAILALRRDDQERILLIGDGYDVTVSPTVTATVDWNGVVTDLAKRYGIGDAEIEKAVAARTDETAGVRVCAKARVAREAA